MFAKLVIVLYAVYIPLMCSCISQATTRAPVLSDCFPHTGTKVKKDWRYTYTKSKANGPAFDEELEAGVNEQINYELSAHYTYLSMSYHFDQDEHYMPGFSKFFKEMAEEEHEHAQKFMKYQNKRGGKIRLNSIPQPCEDGNWGNGTMAMRKALHLENTINYLLLNLHALGDRKNEAQFLDFLESEFLGEQVDSIKQLSNYVHILERLDSSLGEYQFDKLTLGGGKE